MKMRLLVFVLIAVCISAFFVPAFSQQIGKIVTIPQVQMVSLDSLKALDTLFTTGQTKDDSPYWHGADSKADTVRVTGVVIVKPSVLTYTLQRYNTYIQDTTTGQLWAGLNVLTDDSSVSAQGTGINTIDTGMIVTITGRVSEYGSQPNSLTEMFAYKSGFFATVVPISIQGYYGPHGEGYRPAPIEVTIDSFAVGNTCKPSRGEKYESMYVVVRNVTVTSVDQVYGSFTFQDAAGNIMRMYDGSAWFTKRTHANKLSTYTPPPAGSKLKYIRGVVTVQSRTGTVGDYDIMPMYPGPNELPGSTYPGDIVVDTYGPAITNIKRTPTPPKPADVVTVSWRSYNPQNRTQNPDSTVLYYRVGTQAAPMGTVWQRVPSTAPISPDTLYRAQIPAQVEGSLVSYYVKSWLANTPSSLPDTSGPNFYVVRNAGPNLYDVCMTPYSNSLSGFAYDTVTVSGVIVADTSDIKDLTTRGGRANVPLLWLQAGTGSSTNKWNGIQIWSPTALLIDTLKRGDSVSVRGSVYGTSNRTQLAVTSMTLLKRGAVIPSAYIRSMSSSPYFDYTLAATAVIGNSGFQPWMSMLQELDNVYVIYQNADNTGNDPTSTYTYGEFAVSNSVTPPITTYGSYCIRVNDNGVNNFYTDNVDQYVNGPNGFNATHPTLAGLKSNTAYLIPLYAKLSYIRGMLDYTISNYKLEPRKNDDFGTITTGVYLEPNTLPKTFQLSQNYPNPFNPSTTIRYTVPIKSNVTLRIYNILGQEVESLVNMEQAVGSYVVQYNASRLSTGVYFYELRAGDYRDIKKMLLLK